MESTLKRKLIFAAIIVVIIIGILACLHYFPFWVSLTNVFVFLIGCIIGWFVRIFYVKYVLPTKK